MSIMIHTENRIEMLRLLKELQSLRDAAPRASTVARYIAAHFLGADCDRAALKHAKAILALSPADRGDAAS